MTLDPTAILTAIALAFGLGSGGHVVGWGVGVGVVVSTDGVRVGISPEVIVATPALVNSGLGGLTLGDTVLVYDPETFPAWMEAGLPNGVAIAGVIGAARYWPEVVNYERRHLQGWRAFGIGYPLEIIANPCAWDPWGLQQNRCSGHNQPIAPVQSHYMLSWEVGL